MAEVFFADDYLLRMFAMTEFLSSLHPKLVHFPVALLFTGGLLELVAVISGKKIWSNTALLLLGLGVISSIAALISGEQAALQAKELMTAGSPAYSLYTGEIEKHENAATMVVWVFTLLLFIRGWMFIKLDIRKQTLNAAGFLRILSVLLVLTGFYYLYLTGEFGGNLVYKHGIGTELFNPEEVLKDSVGAK